jgi:hypothetical protein
MSILGIHQRVLISLCARALSATALISLHGTAEADSLCTSTTDTFTCLDPAASANGSMTEDANLLGYSWGGLAITNDGDLEVNLDSGQVVTTADFERAVYLDASLGAGGTLTYTSKGTAATTGKGSNTVLLGKSVIANTGTVVTTGDYATGIQSIAKDGDNIVTAFQTTVTGIKSTGILASAANGDNIVNTGTIYATAAGSSGVIAQPLLGFSCGSNVITATGGIAADSTAIWAKGCDSSVVTVNEGVSVSSTNIWGPTVLNFAQTDAQTVIRGNLSATTPLGWVLWADGAASHTLVTNTGVLTGSLWMSQGDDSLTLESGSIWTTEGESGFLTGNDVLSSQGTIRITGSAEFTGLEGFANSGTVDLRDGATGGVLTIDGDFTGFAGSTLMIDADGSAVDKLTINGTASGATSLFLSGMKTVVTTPVLVVDASASSASAFVLGDASATPLIDLTLTQVGADYFITAAPNALAFQPVTVGAVTRDMWHQSADAYASYAVQRRSNFTARRNGIGLWAQFYGSSDRRGDAHDNQTVFGLAVEVDNRVKADRGGGQVGIDYLVRDNFLVGVTGGYERANVNSSVTTGGIRGEGYNLGIYGQFRSATGFYAGLLAKRDWNDVRLTNGAFDTADADPDSTSTGVDAEAGYRSSMRGVAIDLGAGVAYVRNRIHDFSADGIAYDFDTSKSLRGRLGVRAELSGRPGLFAAAKLYHEFKGDSDVRLSSGAETDTIEVDGRGTWGRVEAGFGSRMKLAPMLSAWVDVGDVRGVGLKAGIRF